MCETMSSPTARVGSPSPRRKDEDAPSKARRSSRSDDDEEHKNRRQDSDDEYDRRDRRNHRRRNRSPSPDRREYRDRERDRDRDRDRDDARRRDDYRSHADRDTRRSSNTPTSSSRHDAPSSRDDFPPRFIERQPQPRNDSRIPFDNRVAPHRQQQFQRPMRPMGGMAMSMQGLLPPPNMIRPGMPVMAGMHPPAAIIHSGPPMAHMLQMHQQQLREQEQHRMHQRMASSPRHATHANQGPEHALVVKQVPEYLMDTEKLTKFFKSFGKVVGISLQLPASASVQMDCFESAAKAVESTPGLRMKLLGSRDVKILFVNKEVFRTKFAAWQAAREELRAKSLLPFNWAPPHLRAAIIAQLHTQFDKVKRIVEILSKPNAKVALEKLQTTCDTVTKIMKDLEKMLLLPPLGRENASDGIDVVCNRLQSRVAAVAEALSKIKPLGSTRLDLRSKSFRVLRINKAVSDQSLLESHFCNKKSLKAESVVLDAEASEAVVSFFSRKDAEYAFVRGAQVSVSAAEVAGSSDRDLSNAGDDGDADREGDADGSRYCYGLEEEDDENLDENDDAIDAPAVSGCAGEEEEASLANADDESS